MKDLRFLLPSKLISQECWQETGGSWLREKWLYNLQQWLQSGYQHLSRFTEPSPRRALWRRQLTLVNLVVCGSREELRVCLFCNGQWACLPFAPKGDVSFVILDKTFSLLRRETRSLYFKAICYLGVFEKIAQSKGGQCLCLQNVQKCDRYMEKCLSTISEITWEASLWGLING